MAVIQPPPGFGGTFTAHVHDPSGNPLSVIDAGQPFQVHANWNFTPAGILGGNFEVSAWVESIGGGGNERRLGPPQSVPANATGNYTATINVPANLLPNNPATGGSPLGSSGVYKMVALLTHENFGSQTAIVAVEDMGVFAIR